MKMMPGCSLATALGPLVAIFMCSLLAGTFSTVAEGRLQQQQGHVYAGPGAYMRNFNPLPSPAHSPFPASVPMPSPGVPAPDGRNGTLSPSWNSSGPAPVPAPKSGSSGFPSSNASSPAPAASNNDGRSNSSAFTPSPAPAPATPAPLVPALFIFGDSLVDVGNNNYIGSLARADFYPNGIDFPGHNATGRFCNGKTVLDFISEYVGLPYPPPFMAPTTNGAKLLQGVNYASGAAGILDSTGSLYVQRIPMSQQIRNFETNAVELYFLTGGTTQAWNKYLNEALYAVVIGANDYINNYLQPNSPTKGFYTPQAYQQYVLDTLSTHLQNLYDSGARKVVVTNVGPLGCIPEQISLVMADIRGTCISGINDLIVNFNEGLRSLLSDFNSRYQANATFLYGDVYSTVMQMVSAPRNHGFRVDNAACCGMGRLNAQFPCLPTANVCRRRPKYIFWDAFHPTETANEQLASMLWSGGAEEMIPMNVQQLVAQ